MFKKIHRLVWAGSLVAMIISPPQTFAAERCPEGTVAGACVNADLARAARLNAVVRTQTRLSISSGNYPVSAPGNHGYPLSAEGAQPFTSQRGIGLRRMPGQTSLPSLLYGIRN